MKRWHFYHKDTGLFHGRSFATKYESDVATNTPADHVAIPGTFDYLSQRVDVETGKVVEHRPEQPSEDHDWNGRRWVPKPELQQKIIADRFARIEIAKLEASQSRRVRELLLANDPKLQEIDAKIAEQRAFIISQKA